MTAGKTGRGRVTSWHRRFALGCPPQKNDPRGSLCLPIHHCSILLHADRSQRQRFPERRRLPRKGSTL